MIYKVFVLTILLALTFGCNKSEDLDSEFISIEEFEQQVLDSVDEQVINCGKVEISDPPFVVNTCVSDSYILNIPFYAFYILQGTDSRVALAFTMNADGVVEYWSYDSNIFGGPGSGIKSRVTATVCESPSVSLDLNDISINVIECTR